MTDEVQRSVTTGVAIAQATGSVLCVALLVGGGCWCMWLAVTYPWALAKLLAAVFTFGVAVALTGIALVAWIDKVP